MSKPVAHTVRTNERWVLKSKVGGVTVAAPVITKATVRVAKGAVGGNRPGTFHGATNLRGTVLS